MQLLSVQNQLPNTICDRLRAALQDIVNNVTIHANFWISHPNYKALELPEEAVERFRQVSSEIQNKYLSVQLLRFLYGIYYNGSLQSALALDADETDLALHQNLENNTFMGVDLAFYQRLHDSNNGEGYFYPGWIVIRQESNNSLVVIKDGLTLHIQREQHLQSSAQNTANGESVAIKLPKNRVQNGFYLAVGNAGLQERDVVRVYFNLSTEGAVAVMASLTQQLNAINLRFCFKALYNPSDYGRYDSAVLYIEKNDYPAVYSVLQLLYATHQQHFQPLVPLFTKLIAPGLAIAEEPNHKFAQLESFGMNRCQIVANGLLEAWEQGDTPEHRIALICQQFSTLGIELQRPYLNANSEDIYTSLSL